MDEMETKMRYDFAMSSFARMYGVPRIVSDQSFSRFCTKWSMSEEQIPHEKTLIQIDFYFKDLWDIWGGYL